MSQLRLCRNRKDPDLGDENMSEENEENDWGVIFVFKNGQLLSREETGSHKIQPEFDLENGENFEEELNKYNAYADLKVTK
jgi:hypothetical protein